MKLPIFVRKLSEKERQSLQAGLRSRETFVMRRSQILLASGSSPPKIAQSLGCASQTARNSIRAFNEKGLDALIAGSSTPKRVHAAFDANSVERLRGMLHRSPREFGYESSLWTLQMAAEAAFEEGLTEKRVSGETIRATLSRVLGIRWPSAEAESMAELHRAQMGSHGKRKVVEFDGLLGAYELADRVCRAFGCPHHEHLTIPQEVA